MSAVRTEAATAGESQQAEEFLFPMRLADLERVVGRAFESDEGSQDYSAVLETICGTTDDSQPVEQYDGTLGVTVGFVQANQRPVGQLQWNANLASIYNSPGNVSGQRWATGTLLANNLFLTAGHNFDQSGGGWTRPLQNGTFNTISPQEIATNMHVNFNFQVDPNGVLRTEQQFPVVALVEYRLGGLDFSICRLGGNPAATFGTATVSATDAVQGETICIMGHPQGVPKRVEAGTVFSINGNQLLYDNIDTLGGNSGSGILRASDGRVVGVHTNGGCNTAGTGQNRGFPIGVIIAASPTLQALTAATGAIADVRTSVRDDVLRTTTVLDRTTAVSDLGTSVVRDLMATTVVTDRTTLISDVATTPISDLRTVKALDDVKSPAMDKQFTDVKLPGSDVFDPGGPVVRPGGAARPFILANPHHAMVTETAAGGALSPLDYEAVIGELSQVIQVRQGEVAALEEQLQQVLAEYQEVYGGG
jgi:V8-like Glu-specific endopeptidase